MASWTLAAGAASWIQDAGAASRSHPTCAATLPTAAGASRLLTAGLGGPRSERLCWRRKQLVARRPGPGQFHRPPVAGRRGPAGTAAVPIHVSRAVHIGHQRSGLRSRRHVLRLRAAGAAGREQRVGACRGGPVGVFGGRPDMDLPSPGRCAVERRQGRYGPRLRVFLPPHAGSGQREHLRLSLLRDQERASLQPGRTPGRGAGGHPRGGRSDLPDRDGGTLPVPALYRFLHHVVARAAVAGGAIRRGMDRTGTHRVQLHLPACGVEHGIRHDVHAGSELQRTAQGAARGDHRQVHRRTTSGHPALRER